MLDGSEEEEEGRHSCKTTDDEPLLVVTEEWDTDLFDPDHTDRQRDQRTEENDFMRGDALQVLHTEVHYGIGKRA